MTTSREFLFPTIFCFVLIVSKVLSQTCAESGHWCRDNEACCGGCCRGNSCIDMDRSCNVFDDPCLTHYCPPGEVCYVYQPDCKGCSPMPDCKEASQN